MYIVILPCVRRTVGAAHMSRGRGQVESLPDMADDVDAVTAVAD
jgi:hypothetical protein